ncbi:Uncharacterised protein [Chryseobacterium gleum]|uniref:Uncharacterized protein n=2 Tax=Chryseobacterium gleum TaxID=250 RepID=A0A3S4QVM4_CHRGE|nr:hypothetical protein HMPREF0204_12784 [Chryseobacterium gleum ATCC 35910]VEE06499.1 Uncharacterised protein [Chryseobacterium gleum]
MKKIYLEALPLCAFFGESTQEVVWQKDKSARLEKYYVSMDISTAWITLHEIIIITILSSSITKRYFIMLFYKMRSIITTYACDRLIDVRSITPPSDQGVYL